MSLTPKETKFLINGAAGMVMTLTQAASVAGAFKPLGVWGELMVSAVSLATGLVIGWMNLRMPESMRPPPPPPADWPPFPPPPRSNEDLRKP